MESPSKRYWDWVYDQQSGEWRQPYPHIYTYSSLPGFYIVDASDGKVYEIPDEVGGWCFRRESSISTEGLEGLEAEEARRIVHKLAGGFTWLWPLVQPYIVAD